MSGWTDRNAVRQLVETTWKWEDCWRDLEPGKLYPVTAEELRRNGHGIQVDASPPHCLPCPYKHPLKSMTYGVYRADES